jgi:hypothetical protein
MLKSLFWISLLLVGLAAIVIPGVWIYTVNMLPNAIDSAMDIETHLRQSIESERQGLQMALDAKERRGVKWARPEIIDFPKRLVAMFITETGCPTYFQTPREDGAPWLKRLALKTWNGSDLDGDGACELNYARMLARRLGAKTTLQVAVASDRIHRFLQRDQLVAYNLASVKFEPGLIGVAEASREIMQKELSELSDAELAELQLAIPPWDYWDDIRRCRNAGMLREARDVLLMRLAQQGLISEEMARTAAAQPVRCMSVKR